VLRERESGLVVFYDVRPGNGVGLFLPPRSPHRGSFPRNHLRGLLVWDLCRLDAHPVTQLTASDLHVGYSWAVLCCQASQRVCIKQPSLAQSMLQDSQSESEERVDDGQVPRDSKVVQLKTQLPFIKSQLTVTARYVSLVYLEGWNWTALFR